MSDLAEKQCSNNTELAPKLDSPEAESMLTSIEDDWQLDLDQQLLSRQFEFKNYYQTMAFANAVAWIAHQQDHHPDMTISYRHCHIFYTTHSVKGLSINDFICAARIDALQSI
jgi:4a-hydroxytetrahydrobiopterin dehydratase